MKPPAAKHRDLVAQNTLFRLSAYELPLVIPFGDPTDGQKLG